MFSTNSHNTKGLSLYLLQTRCDYWKFIAGRGSNSVRKQVCINRTAEKRNDLYALGMIFYEMPFRAQNKEEWVHAHLAIMPIPLSTPLQIFLLISTPSDTQEAKQRS